MLDLKTPRGLNVLVAESAQEDSTPRFDADDSDALRRFYVQHGYVVLRSLLSPEQCSEARALWDKEVKPYGGFMYRQATAKVEKHVRNVQGWVMNPILNPQSVDPRHIFRIELREHGDPG